MASRRLVDVMPSSSIKKTTLYIPGVLWFRAKRRALEEETSFNTLLLEGLELRLAQKMKKKGARE
jgi:hypothetical protein